MRLLGDRRKSPFLSFCGLVEFGVGFSSRALDYEEARQSIDRYEMYCENSNEISACRRLILLYLEATPKQPKTFREIVMNVNKMLFKILVD